MQEDPTADSVTKPPALLLGGAALLALFSASCCVLPIGLSIIGLGGAWLTQLGPFVAWRVPILLVLGALLAWAWFAILRPRACKTRRRRGAILAALATAAFLIAASAPLWEAQAEAAMWSLWQDLR
ncbi:hypothetical protein G8O29_07170 [Rhodobacter sp. M37P]|uniref:Mercuric ion transport protein n=2 Tax=Rhodobacter calidifons TaxID=2715277 RepID=A0ABX0G610_9RHOB|nr:hypothetical protein [Rhodobacter calidifons]